MTYHDPAAADHRKSELSPSDGAAPGGPASTAKAPLWIWALGASLIAGLIGGMCGESTYHLVKPLINRSANPTPSGVVRSPTGEWVRRTNLPENFASLGAYDKSAAIADATTEGNIGAERLNSAIAYGVLGAVLAGGLGLAGGFARRSISGGLVAAVVGLVVGGVVGAGMSVALTPLFYKLLQPEVNPLAAPFVSHSLLFAAIGVAGGLALGIGRGRRGWIVRTTLGGLVGALVGTVIIESAVAIMYPLLRVLEPLPGERLPRVATHIIVAVFVALGAVVAARDPSRRVIPSATP